MIRWMRDSVAIKVTPYSESRHGVLLPHSDNEPMQGEVEGVGPSVKEFRAGDKILFPRHVGRKVVYDEEELLVLSDYHILGFV